MNERAFSLTLAMCICRKYASRYHLDCNPLSSEQTSQTCANRELRSTSNVLIVHLKELNAMRLEHIHFSYSTQIESLFFLFRSILDLLRAKRDVKMLCRYISFYFRLRRNNSFYCWGHILSVH